MCGGGRYHGWGGGKIQGSDIERGEEGASPRTHRGCRGGGGEYHPSPKGMMGREGAGTLPLRNTVKRVQNFKVKHKPPCRCCNGYVARITRVTLKSSTLQ